MQNKLEVEIIDSLFNLQDEDYKEFSEKLIPTVKKNKVIGVRSPQLKILAKNLIKNGKYKIFIKTLPHTYLEENSLHSYILNEIKDYDELVEELERFLPFIDNWSTCDILRPKIIKKNTDKFYTKLKKWINSKESWIVRFAVGILLSFYLDKDFKPEHLELVNKIKFKSKYKYDKVTVENCPDKYYVEMMIAWYYATALAKRYDETFTFLVKHKVEPFTKKMILRKTLDSFRVKSEVKKELKNFYS